MTTLFSRLTETVVQTLQVAVSNLSYSFLWKYLTLPTLKRKERDQIQGGVRLVWQVPSSSSLLLSSLELSDTTIYEP